MGERGEELWSRMAGGGLCRRRGRGESDGCQDMSTSFIYPPFVYVRSTSVYVNRRPDRSRTQEAGMLSKLKLCVKKQRL
jgi:hypothetical protein